jgi:electron transfer flavoprotein alpha subunit
VIGETANNKITKLSREILGKAREFADIISANVLLMISGNDETIAKEAISFGADDVFLLEGINTNSYKTSSIIKAVSGIIELKRPEIVFAGETILGCDVMPRIAQRFNTGILSGAVSLEIDPADKTLSCTRSFYGGRIMGITSCPQQRPQIAIIKEGVFREGGRYRERNGVVERIKI